jgi:hypothetical protein
MDGRGGAIGKNIEDRIQETEYRKQETEYRRQNEIGVGGGIGIGIVL